eukprot:CAMPEP_0115284152 /NCGR_PEP_ID=MMETSP0270-20121206/60747_1 /TAXON_ID=71861 /ORGANISM="Scrippsiella trochoidea, Strain CCMP3099" /LENGTH=30 /DNA_ID= /DNA_START= /DNA_END= /DNA_ORIENTATION=
MPLQRPMSSSYGASDLNSPVLRGRHENLAT